MAGGNESITKKYKLEDLLTEKQVLYIIKQYTEVENTEYAVTSDIRPATEGMAGFLGEHMRASLHVVTKDSSKDIELFLKHVPLEHKLKADYINNNNFFRREALLFKLIEEILAADDPNPWCAKAFVYNETLLVMPDLRPQGYIVRPQLETLDLAHMLVTVASVGRFHAAITNYETKRIAAGLPLVSQEHAEILEEPTFKDTPFIRCAVKLTANLLNIFSKKYNNIPKLESKLLKLFLEACDSVIVHNNTLNVLLHKDLWVNNIMYRYEQDAPVNALLIDFQCLRYGPPAFDLAIFLHCTTSRSFREQFEKTILQHYYATFVNEVEESTKCRLQQLGYDEREFLRRYDEARMFGALQAIVLFPFILMDPVTAMEKYNDQENYDKYMMDDRTELVVSYCRRNTVYLERQLELCEEFVDRYMDNLF